MEIEKRKMAAISAAVSAYRREEEEEVSVIEAPTTSFQVLSDAWGLSGRQAIMQMRNLLQYRIFRN